jgi:hypothetical protein
VIYIIKTILPIGDLATGTGTMIGFDNEVQKILAIMTILSGNYLCSKTL